MNALSRLLAIGTCLLLASCGDARPAPQNPPSPSPQTSQHAANDPHAAESQPIDADLADDFPVAGDFAGVASDPPADGPGRTKLEEPQNHGGYFAFAVSPDGKSAAGGTGVAKFSGFGESKTVGGEVLLWDSQSGRLVKTLGSHSEAVSWLAFGDEGRTLASISNKNALAKVWDVESGEETTSIALGGEFDGNGAKPVLAPTGGWLAHVRKETIQVEENDVTIPAELVVWSIPGGQRKWNLEKPWVEVLVASPDGRTLAGYVREIMWETGKDGRARGNYGKRALVLWDAESGDIVWETEVDKQRPDLLAFLPDGSQLAGVAEKSAVFWDAKTGNNLREVELTGKRSPQEVAFSEDGKTLGIARFMGEQVQLWDVERGELTAELTVEFPDTIWHPAFSPDLQRLACQQNHVPVLIDLTSLKKE